MVDVEQVFNDSEQRHPAARSSHGGAKQRRRSGIKFTCSPLGGISAIWYPNLNTDNFAHPNERHVSFPFGI